MEKFHTIAVVYTDLQGMKGLMVRLHKISKPSSGVSWTLSVHFGQKLSQWFLVSRHSSEDRVRTELNVIPFSSSCSILSTKPSVWHIVDSKYLLKIQQSQCEKLCRNSSGCYLNCIFYNQAPNTLKMNCTKENWHKRYMKSIFFRSWDPALCGSLCGGPCQAPYSIGSPVLPLPLLPPPPLSSPSLSNK